MNYEKLTRGQWRRVSDDKTFREAVFVRENWTISVQYRDKTRLAHGWQVSLILNGYPVLTEYSDTLRGAFAGFRFIARKIAGLKVAEIQGSFQDYFPESQDRITPGWVRITQAKPDLILLSYNPSGKDCLKRWVKSHPLNIGRDIKIYQPNTLQGLITACQKINQK